MTRKPCRAANGGSKEGQGPNQKVRSTKTDTAAAAAAEKTVGIEEWTAIESVDLEPYDSGVTKHKSPFRESLATYHPIPPRPNLSYIV